jgi:Na+-transporting methylmalonyl-CoA/oxaloacetate decarboxylase gamma subunit
MSNFTYGLVITVIGMGGTLLSLWLITLMVNLLKRILPYREAEEKDVKEVV